MSDSDARWPNLTDRGRAILHFLRHSSLCLAVCGLTLAAVGCQEATAPTTGPEKPQIQGTRTKPPLPAGYAVLAAQLASEHVFNRDEPELQPDATQLLAEGRGALLDLRGINSADPDIASLSAEAHAAMTSMTAALEQLISLPEPPPAWEQFTEGFIRGFLGDVSGVIQRADELKGQAKDFVRLARQLADGTMQWQTARLLLPRIARKYAGPPVVSGRAVLIDYDAAWGPYGPDDVLTLQSNFGNLTNCTVLVEVQGRTEVSRNVHFLPVWKTGSAIYARYSHGTDFAGRKLLRQSVPDVQRLVVSLWADQLSQENIRYEYAGEEKDIDLAGYCEPIRLSLDYQPLEAGLLWNTNRAVRLQLGGIAWLDHPRVTVTFSRGQEQKSWYQDFDRWEEAEVKTLDTDGGLEWDPEQIEISIGFPSTAYRHTSSWRPDGNGRTWTMVIPSRHQ